MNHARTLANRVVLITGASSGIGRALALELGRAGARLGVLARRRERLEELAEELADHTNVVVLPCDITDEAACASSVDRLAERFGGIDLVINNAGLSMNALFEDTDAEVFRRLMDVNYFGSLHIARAARPYLERSRGGLVFVSSVVGKRGFPTRSGYSASKFAVHALFESLRVEWRDKGIHVGIVAPGYTDTEIRERALGAGGAPRGRQGKTAGDMMTPEQAAGAIIKAAVTRRREVVLTHGGKAMVWINKLLPRLADRLAAKVIG